jgi:hypothetical protein
MGLKAIDGLGGFLLQKMERLAMVEMFAATVSTTDMYDYSFDNSFDNSFDLNHDCNFDC